MHRLSISALIGMLALTITGCGGSTQTNTNTTTTTIQPTVKPSTTTESTPETTQTAQKPTLVAQNTQPPTSTAGLIQSTNANQRTNQVQQGRSDPFAGLFAIPKPVVTVKPRKVVIRRIPKPPVVPPPLPKPVVVKPKPVPIPQPPAPIAPPQPDLARSVTVLGVVEVGNQLQAIVKVPTEATSRYITQGQRLSDGQVLVKRIELSPGAEPVVILEQNGIEVTRAVGEEPALQQEEKTGRPSAAIITSPLSQTSSPSSTAKLNSILPDQSSNTLPVPALPTSRPSSNQQIQSTKQPSIPPPPTSSPLPSLQLNSNLPESTFAVSEPDFPPAAVRTSPVQQPNNQTRVQRQRLIFQLLNSSRQSKSNSPKLKSDSQVKRYKNLLSQLVKRR